MRPVLVGNMPFGIQDSHKKHMRVQYEKLNQPNTLLKKLQAPATWDDGPLKNDVAMVMRTAVLLRLVHSRTQQAVDWNPCNYCA